MKPGALIERGREELMNYGGLLLELPYQVHDTLEQVRDGEVEVGVRLKGLEQITSSADVVMNRLVIAIVMAGLMVGSAILGVAADGGPHIWGVHALTWLGYMVSFGLGLLLVVVGAQDRASVAGLGPHHLGPGSGGARVAGGCAPRDVSLHHWRRRRPRTIPTPPVTRAWRFRHDARPLRVTIDRHRSQRLSHEFGDVTAGHRAG